MCDVDEEAVVSAADAPSIYDIPKVLHAEGLDAYVVRRLGLPFRDVDWSDWDDLLRRVHRPARSVTIALVGKYVDLPDAYLSPAEALRAGGFANDARVNIRWVPSDDCQTPEGAARQLDGVDGVLVPGGFGVRGIEGKIGAVNYARTHGIPLLGLCLGLQCVAIEVARNLAGLAGANSAEFDPDTPYPVIATMADQEDVVAGERDMGGTMRLGLYPAVLAEGSLVRELYGSDLVEERHRHRYEVNNAYRERWRRPGCAARGCRRTAAWSSSSSWSRDAHPFFVATQAHPEFLSRPTRPHPLFTGLVAAALEHSRAARTTRGRQRPPGGGERVTGDQVAGAGSTGPGCTGPGSTGPGRRGPGSTGPGEEPWGETEPRLRDVNEQWPVEGDRSYARGVLVICGPTSPDARRGPGQRDVVEHPGAVAIVALDDDGQVLLIRQYRHPVGHLLWEIPAGLRDVAGEPPRATAERELLEEAGYRAAATGTSSRTSSARRASAPSGSGLPRPRPHRAAPESERGGTSSPSTKRRTCRCGWVPLAPGGPPCSLPATCIMV